VRWGWLVAVVALAGCGRPGGWLEPQIALAPLETNEVVVLPGQSGTTTLRLEPVPGLAEAVGLRAKLFASPPQNVAVFFSPALVATGETVEVRLEALPQALSGRYEVRIFATTPYQTAQTVIRMVIP